MSEIFSKLYTMLVDVILPTLQSIQTSQAEQRSQTELANRSIDLLNADMQLRFAELRADIAACRAEIEQTMAAVRECQSTKASDSAHGARKTLLH